MFKKTISIILAIALSAVLMACGGGKSAGQKAEDEAAASKTEAAVSDTAAAAEGTGQEKGSAAAAEISMEDIPFKEEPEHRDDGGVSMNVFAMDTYMNLLAYGDRAEEAIVAAAAEIHRIDDLLSTGNPESEISKINAAGGGEVSDFTAGLIAESQTLYKETGGLFDIAIYPVMKLWGFPTQEYRVPEKAEIEAALKLADPSAITVGSAPAPAAPAAAEGATSAAEETAPAEAPKDDSAEDAGVPEEAQEAAPAEEPAASPEEDAAVPEEAQEAEPQAAEAPAVPETATTPAESAEAPAEEPVAAPEKDAAAPEEAQEAAPAAAEASTAAAPAAEETAPAAAAGETATGAVEETAPAEAPKVQITFGIPGMEIDLGGIAKGYTSSRVMEIFKEYGVEHGLVSLGGNVQALGGKQDGNPWRVAIQNPESELDYLGVLEIKDKCVITSGGYERFFEQDGVRYHHIIDPRTGSPADSGIISSTIISSDGALADGLSTSLFIMGLEEAEKYWRANADKFDFVLEDRSGKLYISEGAAKMITTEMDMEVVKK